MNIRCICRGGVFLVLAAASLAGCGSDLPTTIPVRGEVQFNGQPMKDGIVVYLPKDAGAARQASGRIRPDGTFVLTTFKNGDGVVPGEYSIIIYAYAPHPGEPKTRAEHEAIARTGELKRGFVIPEKYVDPERSGLSDSVNSDHSGFKRIELTG
jgi:hypothetical protein